MVTSIATRHHRDRRDDQDVPGARPDLLVGGRRARRHWPGLGRQASRTVSPRDDPPMTEPHRRPRLSAVRRGGARVTNLELFFDLVFVLAVTQCTASIEHDPSWTGVFESLAVLALLWWAWGGYAWLTSLIDPEEGPVRLLMFGAMAATAAAVIPAAVVWAGAVAPAHRIGSLAVRWWHFVETTRPLRRSSAPRSSAADLRAPVARNAAAPARGCSSSRGRHDLAVVVEGHRHRAQLRPRRGRAHRARHASRIASPTPRWRRRSRGAAAAASTIA